MSPNASDPLVRFGLFADAHYAEKIYGDRHCDEAPAKLQACVDHFAHSGLDFIVCMGDLIDQADDPQIERNYLERMLEILSGFDGDRHVVLGNHDVATLSKAEFLQHCGSQPYYSFDAGGVHFVVLDGNYHQDGRDFSTGNFSWDQAWISNAQLEWLRQDLQASHPQPVIALCHENVDARLDQGERDPHVLCNAARLRQVLAEANNVRALIQAHYHPGILTTLDNDIDCIGLRAMVVGEGLQNNAYAIASLYSDGRLVIDGFGQQPSYQLEKRTI